jgi:guanylate kinase
LKSASNRSGRGLEIDRTDVPATWPYDELLPSRRGLLVVLSGPSAAGKDAVLEALARTGLPLTRIVTVTTRVPRPTETPGVDYHFVSVEEFIALRDSGQLLEWADVYGKYYGTPRRSTQEALDRGETVVLKIDVQGADQVRRRAPGAVFVFLGPGSFDELVRRLAGRGTESAEAFQRRVQQARDELRQLPSFDYVIVNRQGELPAAVDQLRAVIVAERLRVHPRNAQLG